MENYGENFGDEQRDEDFLRYKDSVERISILKSEDKLHAQNLMKSRWIRLTENEARKRLKEFPEHEHLQKKEEILKQLKLDFSREEIRESAERGKEDGYREILANVNIIVQLRQNQEDVPEGLRVLAATNMTTVTAQERVDKQESIRKKHSLEKSRLAESIDKVKNKILYAKYLIPTV